jgi:hypothetical protein
MLLYSKTHSMPDRIVNLVQRQVRPMVCGKARAAVEFGALGVCRTFPQAQLALPPLLGGSTECCSQPRA